MAAGVLGDAHRVHQRRGLVGRHQARRLADIIGRHAANLGHALGRILRQLGLEVLEALGAIRHKIVVVELLGDQHVHQAVQQRGIGAGLVTQVDRRILRDRDPPRVGDDQRNAPLLDRLAQLHAEHRMLLGGVRADDEETLGALGDVVERVGHGPRAERCPQTGDGGAVSQPRTVVDAVRLHQLAGQLGCQEVFLVGAPRRAQGCKSIAARRPAWYPPTSAPPGPAPDPRTPRPIPCRDWVS